MTEFFLYLIVLAMLGLGSVAFNDYSCQEQWPMFEHRYGMVSGCMINVPGKGWMPAENYRVL